MPDEDKNFGGSIFLVLEFDDVTCIRSIGETSGSSIFFTLQKIKYHVKMASPKNIFFDRPIQFV